MPTKAWQRLKRDAKANISGEYQESSTDLSLAVVRECSRPLATKMILEYEWLGTMPLSSWHVGIFFDGWKCGGVAVFCIGGAGINAPKQFGLISNEIAYLARGACAHWTPTGSASKLIGHSLRMARKKGLKLAIAYADTDAGEIGTVYQATNWLCIGQGASTKQMIHPMTGRIYDQKISYDRARGTNFRVTRGHARRHLLAHGFIEQDSNPKWRYIYILADGAERAAIYDRIAHLIVPYPKRQKDSSEPLGEPAKKGRGSTDPDAPDDTEAIA
jgi:hypothetical protein